MLDEVRSWNFKIGQVMPFKSMLVQVMSGEFSSSHLRLCQDSSGLFRIGQVNSG
jgi:hypothetical protein